jgi:hypothetical protein
MTYDSFHVFIVMLFPTPTLFPRRNIIVFS